MNIHEYQAKELLEKFGVATTRGKVASTPEEAAMHEVEEPEQPAAEQETTDEEEDVSLESILEDLKRREGRSE